MGSHRRKRRDPGTPAPRVEDVERRAEELEKRAERVAEKLRRRRQLNHFAEGLAIAWGDHGAAHRPSH